MNDFNPSPELCDTGTRLAIYICTSIQTHTICIYRPVPENATNRRMQNQINRIPNNHANALKQQPQGTRSTHTSPPEFPGRSHRRRKNSDFLCSLPSSQKEKYLAVPLLGTSETQVPKGARFLKGMAADFNAIPIPCVMMYWEDRGVWILRTWLRSQGSRAEWGKRLVREPASTSPAEGLQGCGGTYSLPGGARQDVGQSSLMETEEIRELGKLLWLLILAVKSVQQGGLRDPRGQYDHPFCPHPKALRPILCFPKPRMLSYKTHHQLPYNLPPNRLILSSLRGILIQRDIY